MIADVTDRPTKFLRRHSSPANTNIFQTTVTPDQLHSDYECHRIRIQPTYNILLLHLVKQGHCQITKLFIPYPKLRVNRDLPVIEITRLGGLLDKLGIKIDM